MTQVLKDLLFSAIMHTYPQTIRYYTRKTGMDRYHKDTPMITVRRMGRIIRIIKTIRIQGIIFYKQICLVFDALQRVGVAVRTPGGPENTGFSRPPGSP